MTDAAAVGGGAGTSAPQKLDPEGFALRGHPRAVVRFWRWLIVALAAMFAVILILTAWFALRPRIFRIVATDDQQSQPSGSGSTEALAQLPASYADVPKLRPPLPGDLGKPILNHQQAVSTPNIDGERATQALAAER